MRRVPWWAWTLGAVLVVLLGLWWYDSIGLDTTELDENEAKWDAAQIANYSYTFSCGSFAGEVVASVTVRNDIVVDMHSVSPVQCGGDNTDEFPTIDGLFDIARDAHGSADAVDIDYGVHGIPIIMSVDQDPGVDDEWGMSVSDFVRL